MTYKETYEASLRDREAFWSEQAKKITWFKEPEEVLGQDEEGLYRWFRGGFLNTCYLAVDHHVENGRADQAALIYDSPVTGARQQFTFRQLQGEVAQLAGALHQLGVHKGDRVIIYMPMIPQTVFAMLACARIGAIHSVVFGGFAAHELALRVDDAKPKVILTASGGKEIDRIVAYKPIIDAALREAAHQPKAVVVYQRDFVRATMSGDRDLDWESLRRKADPVPWAEVEATDTLYILYTSGTTGQPKGICRDNGGHAVALYSSMELLYGTKPGEVFWAASDVGWVVGHSYIVYGPLMFGCTTVLFEGKPVKTPDAGAFWRVISDYQVRVLFTAPTAFRAVKKEDPEGRLKQAYDTSCLRYLFLAGERTDVATYNWLTDLLNIPVIDHWWQTESGWPMICNPTGIEVLPIKPGSAGVAAAGFDIHILDENANELGPDEEGAVVVRTPLNPGCLPTLWQDTPRFKEAYFSQFPGFYFTGDGGYKDEDGYFYITGRIDDIINVAGHRLSTARMEEVVASHPAVAECAVVGIEDALKGQVPVGFVVLKAGAAITPETLEKELIQMIRNEVGPVAAFKRAAVARRLPKTRSGKVLRKIIRFIADGKSFSPPSTIEDMAVLDEIGDLMAKGRIGLAFQE